MQTGHILRVFVASPGDVAQCRREAIDSLLRLNARFLADRRPIAIQPVMWETHAQAGMGKDAQGIINPLVDDCDVLIAIFWRKVGTKTPRAKSGTIEEVSRFIKKGGGERALVFFCERPNPARVENLDAKEIKDLQTFVRDMKRQGLCVGFKSVADFGKKLQHHLSIKLDSLIKDLPVARLPHTDPNRNRPVSTDRLALVPGQWEGRIKQDVAVEGMGRGAKVDMSLSVDGRRIFGHANLTFRIDGKPSQLVLIVEGRYQNDRFLKFGYTSNVAGATHFGTFILTMNPVGTRLSGRYLGYGAFSEKLVWGDIKLGKASAAGPTK